MYIHIVYIILDLFVFFLNRYLFGNLTVVSSRMELNFEPNSSVLSCATVREEKKQTRKETQRSHESRRQQCVDKVMVICNFGLLAGQICLLLTSFQTHAHTKGS